MEPFEAIFFAGLWGISTYCLGWCIGRELYRRRFESMVERLTGSLVDAKTDAQIQREEVERLSVMVGIDDSSGNLITPKSVKVPKEKNPKTRNCKDDEETTVS